MREWLEFVHKYSSLNMRGGGVNLVKEGIK